MRWVIVNEKYKKKIGIVIKFNQTEGGKLANKNYLDQVKIFPVSGLCKTSMFLIKLKLVSRAP